MIDVITNIGRIREPYLGSILCSLKSEDFATALWDRSYLSWVDAVAQEQRIFGAVSEERMQSLSGNFLPAFFYMANPLTSVAS